MNQSIIKNESMISTHKSRFDEILQKMNQSQIPSKTSKSILSTTKTDLSGSFLGVSKHKRKIESSGSKFIEDMNSRMQSILGRTALKKIKKKKFNY